MTNVKTCMRLLALPTMVLSMGCAPAYHSYSDCTVPCNYGAPPPLPYTHYDDCVCHSHAASVYVAGQSQSLEQVSPEEQRDEETE